METVIRVDNCWTNQSKTVELEVAWSKGHRRLSMLVGSHYEYLWREFDVYSRPLEILTDDDCNVANSYVLLCANIDNVQCRVKIGTDFDVHCQCEERSDPLYFALIAVLIILVTLSKTFSPLSPPSLFSILFSFSLHCKH